MSKTTKLKLLDSLLLEVCIKTIMIYQDRSRQIKIDFDRSRQIQIGIDQDRDRLRQIKINQDRDILYCTILCKCTKQKFRNCTFFLKVKTSLNMFKGFILHHLLQECQMNQTRLNMIQKVLHHLLKVTLKNQKEISKLHQGRPPNKKRVKFRTLSLFHSTPTLLP